MTINHLTIRPARLDELDTINEIIEAAVMSWELPDRVKRLAMPSYRYDEFDFKHQQIWVAEDEQKIILGAFSLEDANAGDLPEDQTGLLLHGIYVKPSHHYQGIGRQLLQKAKKLVREMGKHGLLVKAQEDAIGFFVAMGMHLLHVKDCERHYNHRFWMVLD